jgi:S-adenosylmethionine-dependent methyltransferase
VGLHVVDAGGGTGGFAVPLALAGHQVTVVDPSPDSLAALQRRARDAGVTVTGLQGDLENLSDLVEPGTADVVLCHRVLEVLDSQDARTAALAAIVQVLRPGGLLSVLVANRLALVLHRAVAGRLAEASALLHPVPAPGPLDRLELEDLLRVAGLQVQAVHGARVVADLVPGAVLDDPEHSEALTALELSAADHPLLRDVASALHALATKPR